MTLEDFFTLTEMKDGFTAPSRVKELINVMLKEKDCMTKNVGDATRQWSTVGSTIAATENKDCLDLFIQLNGLWFIDRWLEEAQRLCNDTSDSFVEESITALLRALKKLRVDSEKSVSSGIWKTVKGLLGHNSSRVQDLARALFDSWKNDTESDAIPHDAETVEATSNDVINVNDALSGKNGHPECSPMDGSFARSDSDEKNVEPVRAETMLSNSVLAPRPENGDDVRIPTADETLDHAVLKDGPAGPLDSSAIMKSVNENLSIKLDCPMYDSGGASSTDTSIPAVIEQHIVERQSDATCLTECTDDTKRIQHIRNSPERLGVIESPLFSSPLKHGDLSSGTDAKNSLESLREPYSQRSKDAKDEELCAEILPSGDVEIIASKENSWLNDCGSSSHDRNTKVLTTIDYGGKCFDNGLWNYSCNDRNMEKFGDPETSSIENIDAVDEVKDRSSNKGEVDLLKKAMRNRVPYLKKKATDIELDYGIVDPLEVARQVAIEVEREVVDCREPSCTSSEKVSEGGFGQPDSPDSTDGMQSQPSECSSKEILTGTDQQVGKELSISEDDPVTEHKKHAQGMQSSQVTETAQGLETDSEKGICAFDLNQEFFSDDMDLPLNPISTPVPLVSASRASVASGSPAAPWQFEGSLGWKGSAATSAFRPASPRRTPEGEKNVSVGGSSSSLKQRQDCLIIDLNVAEGGDENRITDPVPRKPFPVLSGESSLEASPRRAERHKLDLNCISEEGETVGDSRMEGHLFFQRNGHHSPSPSSSSSSMFPSLRNIDLNNQPFSFIGTSDHPHLGKSPHILNVSGGLKSDDSIISIMGARVGVNKKDTALPTLPFPNGRISETGIDLNFARTGGVFGMGSAMPFTPASVYGINGFSSGLNISSTIYGPGGGPIPYLVGSRGAPVVPQIVGSTSSLSPAFSQPPFVMSLGVAPSGSNGHVPSRNNFDLNSGLAAEGGNKDLGGLRQFFNPGQLSLDEHLRTSVQPSSIAGGGKRKEPDGGWESSSFSYKHHPPPWK